MKETMVIAITSIIEENSHGLKKIIFQMNGNNLKLKM